MHLSLSLSIYIYIYTDMCLHNNVNINTNNDTNNINTNNNANVILPPQAAEQPEVFRGCASSYFILILRANSIDSDLLNK